MPIYENGPVQIHYEEAGSGFPLLVIPGGGLNWGWLRLNLPELLARDQCASGLLPLQRHSCAV